MPVNATDTVMAVGPVTFALVCGISVKCKAEEVCVFSAGPHSSCLCCRKKKLSKFILSGYHVFYL
jgi:hypothetical protein